MSAEQLRPVTGTATSARTTRNRNSRMPDIVAGCAERAASSQCQPGPDRSRRSPCWASAILPLRAQNQAAPAGDRIFHTTRLHRIHLTISAAEWAVLQTSTPRGAAGVGRPAGDDYTDASGRLIHIGGGFGGYFPWAHADVRLDDGTAKTEFKNVGVRYKGNLSFSSTSAAAPLFANFKSSWTCTARAAPGTAKRPSICTRASSTARRCATRSCTPSFVRRRPGAAHGLRRAHRERARDLPGHRRRLVHDDRGRQQEVVERALPPGTGLLMKPEGLRGGMQNAGATWASCHPVYRPIARRRRTSSSA